MKTFVKNCTVVTAMITGSTLLFSSCSKDDYKNPAPPTINAIVASSAGDSNAIVIKLNEFRNRAGAVVNNTPGATSGRREVNWDGVPANLTNANNFPFDFFGASDATLPAGRKRGLITTNTGTSFRVDSTGFADIDASYASQFAAFSKKKLFAYLGNVITEVTFKVPGTLTDASVNDFAVIFSDVDVAGSTTVEYFNGIKSLGIFSALPAPQGFSLIGVSFPDDKVTRIKITVGNGLLAIGAKDISNGGNKDLVVMDDFLYSEPKSLQ